MHTIGNNMILDTNALSAASFGDPAIAKVLTIQPALYVPVIVIGEYRFGIAKSTKRDMTEAWLELFLGAVNVLNIVKSTAQHYADLYLALKQAGTPIPINDVWIAALAIENNLPLLSRDTHFDKLPTLRRVEW